MFVIERSADFITILRGLSQLLQLILYDVTDKIAQVISLVMSCINYNFVAVVVLNLESVY